MGFIYLHKLHLCYNPLTQQTLLDMWLYRKDYCKSEFGILYQFHMSRNMLNMESTNSTSPQLKSKNGETDVVYTMWNKCFTLITVRLPYQVKTQCISIENLKKAGACIITISNTIVYWRKQACTTGVIATAFFLLPLLPTAKQLKSNITLSYDVFMTCNNMTVSIQ